MGETNIDGRESGDSGTNDAGAASGKNSNSDFVRHMHCQPTIPIDCIQDQGRWVDLHCVM